MGLLELLQQGQTQLSAGSFPGDTPINDPQSGFVQTDSPTNTYEDNVVGQPNNGSTLVNTLPDTALDNTEPESTTSILSPQSNTSYPYFVSGIFGYAASQFTQPYNPVGNGVNGYAWVDNINDIVNIETNPQILTLSQTSLDNTDLNSISATVNPLSIETPYPYFANGKWRGNAMQFSQIWNADYIYINNYTSNQTNTLSQTSLDNTIPSSQNTTYPVPNANAYPNDYVTLGYLAPQIGMGMFGFGPGQYNSNYNWAGGYYSQNSYNNIITTSDNPLVNYIPVSGLSPNNNEVAAFILSNNTGFNQTYLGNLGFPQLVTGDWGNGPQIFSQYYSPDTTYLNDVDQFGGIHTENELSRTSLDNNNSENWSNIVPDSIAYPNNYPILTTGEFNGAPSQYVSPYNSSSTYLDSVSIQDPNSPQIPTLGETGLDLDNSTYSPTAIQPNNISYPNNYPAIEGVNLGGFGGPEQYDTNWNQDNTYLNSFNPDLDNSIQFAFTGSNLDNSSTGVSALSHVIPPISIYKPNDYPIIPNVNLGEFNTGPSQYVTPYNPTNTYLDQYNELKDVNTNPQKNTLNKTALDVDDSGSLPTSLIYAPTNPDTITEYPASNATGATGSYAQGFNQIWRPVKRYYNDYIKPLKDQNLV